MCNENLVEDEHLLMLATSMYKVLCEKYNDFLHGHDNLRNHTQIPTMKGEQKHACIISTLRVFNTDHKCCIVVKTINTLNNLGLF